MENAQQMIEEEDQEEPNEESEEEEKEKESNEDPLGLDNMFGKNSGYGDSGLAKMPMMDLDLGF